MQSAATLQNVIGGNEAQWGVVTPLSEMNSWLRSAQRKVSELANLPPGWDGYNSRPVQQQAIERTLNILKCIAGLRLPRPQIFPVPGGGLQVEFSQDGRELEIETLPDGSVEYLITDPGGHMVENSIPANSNAEIYRIIYWLQGKAAVYNLDLA